MAPAQRWQPNWPLLGVLRALSLFLSAMAGAVAALVNPVFSVVSGGVACVVGIALLALALPEMRKQVAADEDARLAHSQ